MRYTIALVALLLAAPAQTQAAFDDPPKIEVLSVESGGAQAVVEIAVDNKSADAVANVRGTCVLTLKGTPVFSANGQLAQHVDRWSRTQRRLLLQYAGSFDAAACTLTHVVRLPR